MIRRLGTFWWCWAILAASLFAPLTVRGQEKPVQLPFTEKHIHDSIRTDWYGVYLSGKKIGWARSGFEKAKLGDDSVYRTRIHLQMQAKSVGVSFKMILREESNFDSAPPYRLRRAVSSQEQDGVKQETVLERKGNGYTASTTTNGQTTSRNIGKIDQALSDLMTPYVWLLGGPKHGDKIVTRTFDFDRLKVELQHHTIRAVKTTLVKGVKLKYFEVEVFNPLRKIKMLERFDSEGNMLSGKIGNFFELRLETEKLAKRLDKSYDLFLTGMVKIDKSLSDSEKITGLTVELVGKEAKRIPSGPRQAVSRTANGKYICNIGKRFGKRTPATKKEIADSLAATLTYPADHPRVRKLAEKAVGAAKTQLEKVKRLVRFVHDYIRPSYRIKGLIVLDLLEKKKGDCTAYAALFTTLARAAGIPAREVSGFAYMGDGQKSFGGHAWNEVVLDGVWHPIDASMDQFEVDAARISLGSDIDGGMNLLRNYGSLSLRLIAIERR